MDHARADMSGSNGGACLPGYSALKTCTSCHESKSLPNFAKGQGRCRPCASAAFKEWRIRNKEMRAQYIQEWEAANRYQRDRRAGARGLIQARVQTGLMPAARTRPCVDCGSTAADYDHFAEYEGVARAMVEPVCKPCHLARTVQRAVSE